MLERAGQNDVNMKNLLNNNNEAALLFKICARMYSVRS